MLTDADRRWLDLLKRCLTASIYEESAWRLVQTDLQVRKGNDARSRRFDWLRERLVKVAASRSWALVKTNVYAQKVREEGLDWPLFGYTMVGHKRLDHLQTCIEDVVQRQISGDFVETGVWRGGTVIFMRAMLKALGVSDRTIWAADSFDGLPRPESASDGLDLSNVDFLKVSLDEVKNNFRRFDLLDEQVRFLQGWFADTLPTAPIDKIAILRLDGDLYGSTMDALTGLYHKVVPGGYCIIDDYHSWEACKRAVHDFFELRGEKPNIQNVDASSAFLQVTGGQPSRAFS